MMPAAPAIHPPMQPHAPAGPSPLIAMLMQHAHPPGGMPSAPHPGMQPQGAGAPMPLGPGGHAAPKFGHAPSMAPGC